MPKEFMGNDNRIVRVHNDELHETITLIADDLNVDYQFIFSCWTNYVLETSTVPKFSVFHLHCKACKLLR